MSEKTAKVVKVLSWGMIYFIISMLFGGNMPFWAYFLTIFLCYVSSGIFDSIGRRNHKEDSEDIKEDSDKETVEISAEPVEQEKPTEKAKTDEPKQVADMLTGDKMFAELMNKVFPGGKTDVKVAVKKILSSRKVSARAEVVEKLFVYEKVLFEISEDRSKARIVEGAMRRPDNEATREDASSVYDFIVEQYAIEVYGNSSSMIIGQLNDSLGNSKTVCRNDVIEGAYGKYGWDVTNPIPTRGVTSEPTYLNRLRTKTGGKIKWNRLGSSGAQNIKYPIDIYVLIDEQGKKIGTIYISPYQNVTSSTAPEGLKME